MWSRKSCRQFSRPSPKYRSVIYMEKNLLEMLLLEWNIPEWNTKKMIRFAKDKKPGLF